MRYPLWLALGAAALTGCPGHAPVGAPSLSVAAADDGTRSAVLTWTRPVGVEAFEVQARLVPYPWESLGFLPADATTVTLSVSDSAPEAVDLEFRIRAIGGSGSTPSAPVSFHLGLVPPFGFQAVVAQDGVLLSFFNASPLADDLVLERRAAFPDGSASPWISRPAPFGQTWLDPDLSAWTDGARLEYRLVLVAGPERSPAVRAATGVAPLLAPAFTAIDPLPGGGVRLVLESRSAWDTALVVRRTLLPRPGLPIPDYPPGELVATLAADATSFDDAGASPGFWGWSVHAVRSLGELVESEDVQRVGVSPPPEAWGTTLRVVEVLPGEALARAPSGAFAAAGGLGGSPFGSPWLSAPGEAAPSHLPPEGTRDFLPGLRVDADGHPHAVYAEAPAPPADLNSMWTDPVPIVHVWHDGGSWQREEIARRVLSPGDATQIVRFDIGLDGTLHASWLPGPDALDLEVATRGPGGWTIAPVGAAVGAPWRVRWPNHFLAGDAAGAPHVVALDWDRHLVHLFEGPAGWAGESIPTGDAVEAWLDPDFLGVLATDDGLAVVYLPYEAGVEERSIRVQRRTAAGWEAAALVGTMASPSVSAARSVDGTRLAVAAKGVAYPVSDGALWIVEGGAVAEKRWFGPPGRFAVGFDAADKAWIADGLDSSSGTLEPVAAALFEER